MSSIVGMTSVVCGASKEKRLSSIDGIIRNYKKRYSSVSVEYLTAEKNSLGIGEIRSLIEKSSYTSLSHQHRLYIICDAHKLTDQAQNALLKIYEEPKPDITYILELDSRHALLPTILSRAVVIDVQEEYHPEEISGFPSFKDFNNLTLPDIFKLCEESAKDKQGAGNFLTFLTSLSKQKLEKVLRADEKKTWISFVEFLLQAREWLNDTNINTRLLLENCALGWWNLKT